MKYVVYKNINTPFLIVNEKFEFFDIETKKQVSKRQQEFLETNFSNWMLPDYVCVNLQASKKTSIRLIYEKSLKVDWSDEKTLRLIDDYRKYRYNEKTIANELGTSCKSLQRHYPRKLSQSINRY